MQLLIQNYNQPSLKTRSSVRLTKLFNLVDPTRPSKVKGRVFIFVLFLEPGRITEDYDVAMKELSDPLLPTRGHAILHLSSLLERGDVKTLGNAEELLPVFLDNLSHEDTFIYLASVRAIASLSKSQHSIVIPHLAKEFAMFPDKCNEKFKNEQFASKDLLKILRFLCTLKSSFVLPHFLEPLISFLFTNCLFKLVWET